MNHSLSTSAYAGDDNDWCAEQHTDIGSWLVEEFVEERERLRETAGRWLLIASLAFTRPYNRTE
jgi:hypothetical protein